MLRSQMSASTSDIKWEKHEDAKEGVRQKKNRADGFLEEEMMTARGGVAVVNLLCNYKTG